MRGALVAARPGSGAQGCLGWGGTSSELEHCSVRAPRQPGSESAPFQWFLMKDLLETSPFLLNFMLKQYHSSWPESASNCDSFCTG